MHVKYRIMEHHHAFNFFLTTLSHWNALFRHIVKTKVSFDAYLNELSFWRTNQPGPFLRKKYYHALELWLSIQWTVPSALHQSKIIH